MRLRILILRKKDRAQGSQGDGGFSPLRVGMAESHTILSGCQPWEQSLSPTAPALRGKEKAGRTGRTGQGLAEKGR